MPPPVPTRPPARTRHTGRARGPAAATILRRSARPPVTAILRRSAPGTLAVLTAALLAAATLTAPAALARPAEPGPAVPVPGPSARPSTTRPADPSPVAPAGDLGSLRARATRLRAKLDGQHRRLEVLAEDLEEAYARGVGLLADAAELDRKRGAAEREVAAAQAELDERARSSYMAGPGLRRGHGWRGGGGGRRCQCGGGHGQGGGQGGGGQDGDGPGTSHERSPPA